MDLTSIPTETRPRNSDDSEQASARLRIRDRTRAISDELETWADFIEFGATRDIDYQMADARMEALRHERNLLKEIAGDL